MTLAAIAVLPGDGIGPEVVRAALLVLKAAADRFGFGFSLDEYPIGAVAVASHGDPFPPVTRDAVVRSDAVLLGAVGDPSLDGAPRRIGMSKICSASSGIPSRIAPPPVMTMPELSDRS